MFSATASARSRIARQSIRIFVGRGLASADSLGGGGLGSGLEDASIPARNTELDSFRGSGISHLRKFLELHTGSSFLEGVANLSPVFDPVAPYCYEFGRYRAWAVRLKEIRALDVNLSLAPLGGAMGGISFFICYVMYCYVM